MRLYGWKTGHAAVVSRSQWDATKDTSSPFPRMVTASATDLG